MKFTAPTKEELQEITQWMEKSEAELPENIALVFKKMIAVYGSLGQSLNRAKQTLHSLRQAMGILPKSERGGGQKADQEILVFPENLSSDQKDLFANLEKKRNEHAAQKVYYNGKIKALKIRPRIPSQLEFDLTEASEIMFSFPTSAKENNKNETKVDRMKEFEKTTGFHVAYDFPKRFDLKVLVTEINYKVETVTDLETGKSVRASMASEGPEKFQFTWGAFSNLLKMHVGFAIPINRICLMIGQPEFTSGKVCRALEYLAENLAGVYLSLAENLADVPNLSGDDTSTKIIDVGPGKEDSLSQKIDEYFGWSFQRKDGKGEKTGLNVSLLVGKTEAHPQSTIRFYRTHLGSVGNLLTKILETRSPKLNRLVFQGDLSTSNLPSAELLKKFELSVAGCGAHARRPFFRYKDEDMSLCYYALRCFLALTLVEKMIDEKGRTRETVMKLRNRYSRKIWIALKNRCHAAIDGSRRGPATPPKWGVEPNIWPPGTELNKACNYVIKNFDALTLYLDRPELALTNNGRERALRIEKCMLNGSKFRKTRNGRAVIDVLRTINSTCTAAGVDPAVYLPHVFKDLPKLHNHPELCTPFVVAKELGLVKLQ